MKNEKIKEFLTKLTQEEGFKVEFLKLKEKVEKKGFSKKDNEKFISECLLPWSKKLGYELTKKDFIDFDKTQKPSELVELSMAELENVSGGFGFPMLLSLFAMFGSSVAGMVTGGAGTTTPTAPQGSTGIASMDYYEANYVETPADFGSGAGKPMSTALVTTPDHPQTSVEDYNENFARSSAAADSGENVIQMLKDIHGANFEQNYGETSVDDYNQNYGETSVDDYNQNYARISVDDYSQNYAKSPLPENSPLSARKNELYKKLDAVEDNYRFLEERGDDRAGFEEISKYRNIIQNAATDDVDFNRAANNIDAVLSNTNTWREAHLRDASSDKETELTALIEDAYIDDPTASSLYREVRRLYSKTRNAKEVDIIRTNGFEEEWKQLEDKIHNAIEDYNKNRAEPSY